MTSERITKPPTSSEHPPDTNDEVQITLFAPFEANKSSRAPFLRSSENDSDESRTSVSSNRSREIEFQNSESRSAGKVLFRKIKSAVSGSSSASSNTFSGPSPAQTSVMNKPPNVKGPAMSSSNNAALSNQATNFGDGLAVVMESTLDEDPRISLTSYSDAHSRMVAKQQGRDSGGSRVQSQAVNKTEMLKRFGSIAENKVQDTNADFRKYWMPDKACKECSDCGVKFNVFVRKHHCRICGRIFCHSCCNVTIPGNLLRSDLQGNLRVCKDCCEVFKEFCISKMPEKVTQTSDSIKVDLTLGSTSPHPSLGAESSQPLSNSGNLGRPHAGSRTGTMSILSPHKSWDEASSGRSQEIVEMSPSHAGIMEFDNPTPTRRRLTSRRPTNFDAISANPQRRSIMILDEDEVGFIASGIWTSFMDPTSGCSRMNRRHRLRVFPDSYTGACIVDWLLQYGHIASRSAGIQVGQALVDTKRLKIVSSVDPEFKDEGNLFLELGEAAQLPVDEEGNSPVVRDAPKWFQHLPQESDSEYEVSPHLPKENSKSTSTSPRSHTPPYKPLYDHSVTLSSVSKLTGSQESNKEMTKPSKDDYLVIDEELMSKSITMESSHSSPSPLSTYPSTLPIPPDPSIQDNKTEKPKLASSPASKAKYSTGLVSTESSLLSFDVERDGIEPAYIVGNQDDVSSSSSSRPKSYGDVKDIFKKKYNDHFDTLMTQVIKSYGLSLSWLDILRPCIFEAVQTVRTDVTNEDVMDINEYIRVKKIPCIQDPNCSLNFGVVCTKNVTHKKMCTEIKKPTILLLKCAFDFQRRENQFSSFDTLYLQETKYLNNLVDKVKAFSPRIILVQKSVSRLALENLYDLGIVVVVNVKPSVMSRVARCTQGEILTSLDQLFFDVRLGTCGKFYLRNYTLESGIKKTLMYFDDCNRKFGCVVTLQGGTKQELKKVKKVTQFGLHLAHNSLLESSFLLDEFACPSKTNDSPPSPPEPYSSTPVTPEYPLYPSLAHPFESLPPAEVVKRLQSLGLCGDDFDTNDALNKETDEDSETPLPALGESDSTTTPSFQIGGNENSGLEIGSGTCIGEKVSVESNDRNGMQSDPPTQVHTKDDQFVVPPQVDSQTAPTKTDSHTGLTKTDSQTVSTQVDSTTMLQDIYSLRLQGIDKEVLATLSEKEFEAAMRRQILSISPDVKFGIPYLQTVSGREADVRQYLPSVIYWSYQFKPVIRPKVTHGNSTDQLEMGLTKGLADAASSNRAHPRSRSFSRVQSQLHQPSYRSVSEHPLTNSFLLLKADTNEMQAALADFRARAGVPSESNSFFFKSARRAADYHLHLQNVFNKYKQFENEFDQKHEEEEKKEEEEDRKKTCLMTVSVGGVTDREATPTVTIISASQHRSEESSALTSNRQETEKCALVTSAESGHSHASHKMHRSFRAGSAESPGHDIGFRFRTRNLEDMDLVPRDAAEEDDENLEKYGLELSYNDWLTSDQQTDCLDPYKHQGISVLFSNTCHDGQKHQRPCLNPCVIPMFYYGHNDISIGDFLQRYCFRDYYRCQTCSVDMAKHVRHIIHGPRAIHINIQTAPSDFQGKEDSIYTWLYCTKCRQTTPYTPMDPNSLLFSFAKFLELKFYCDSYTSRSHIDEGDYCTHSFHKDYCHCFLFRNKLAHFRPSTVCILEVLLPPRAIYITTPNNKYHLDYATDIKHVSRIVEGVFYRIRQKLERYRLEPISGSIDDHISNSKAERDALRTKVKYLKELVISGGFIESKTRVRGVKSSGSGPEPPLLESIELKVQEESIGGVLDGLADLKRAITEVVECWNILLEELDARVREYRRRIREAGGGSEVVMADGFSRSPRDSPVAAIQSVSDSIIMVTSKPTPLMEVPPIRTPISQSPETSNHSSSNHTPEISIHTSSNASSVACLPEEVRNHLAMPTDHSSPKVNRKISHERNHSDGGGVASATKDKGHKRNLSDSQTIKEGKRTPPPSTELALPVQNSGSTTSNLCVPETDLQSTTPSFASSSSVSGKDSSSFSTSPLASGGTQTDGESSGARGGVVKEKEEHQLAKRVLAEEQVEEDSHTDNPGGFLAKFRDIHIGREDGRDDPTKFYLLDPYTITTGVPPPKSSVHGNGNSGAGNGPHDPPGGKSAIKRYGGVGTRKAGSVTSLDEGKGEKKGSKDKDRNSILSRPFQKLPPPFEFNEHHTMHSHTTLPIAIYEKEPTSIIAYALASREYTLKLVQLKDKSVSKIQVLVGGGGGVGGVVETKASQSATPKVQKRLISEPEKPSSSTTSSSKGFFSELKKKGSAINIFSGLTSSTTAAPSEMVDPFDQSFEPSVKKLDSSSSGPSTRSGEGSGSDTSTSAVLPPGGGQEDTDQGKSNRAHIGLEFSNPDKTANFFCKVYFAEEFRQLRERIFPSGEERFIHSLTRCVKYEAKGGKSRSAFCKVADDRFILKQIKSIEISAFEDFAPRYLDYVNKALEERRPLALAKILGAYSIGFKNSKTGNSKRMDVVVMENLLYNHNVSRVFDLKGSMRSRYIDPSKDSSGDVLLDENYLNTICHDPVYVHPHSKFVLMQAVFADSEFLAQNSIMDYSLLTCIDNTTGQLIVGIIDYVRTFTFDKRLEMYLKKTSGRELPTVVYPELYRKRFYEAMERYFTVVPDKWSGLGADF